ncbi:MAG: hypothetical protein KA397_03940 [Paludibacteraceae bacterium]|nr:hypothetical protein [Paludibacteraceae bacterium]MBP6284561.1 hypothetical protein [Paludibacteraceae bacterium]
MQGKLQELTEKIYNEGVQKAQQQVEIIVKEANEKALTIEEEAKKKAKSIIEEAEKKAELLTKHVQSELKMSITQAQAALKQTLSSLITTKAIDAPVKELFENKDFLQDLIKTIVGAWISQGITDLQVILPEKSKKEMDASLKKQLIKELNSGVELVFSDTIKSGFKVAPTKGGYQLSFTDQDFINYFKAYLRPKTTELLFENE